MRNVHLLYPFATRGTRTTTFFRLLRLTDQGIKANRNQKEAFAEIQKVITDNGGKLVGAWFTQGDYDLISIIEAEDDQVMRTISAHLAVKGLYTGKTLPAMTMDAFIQKFWSGCRSRDVHRSVVPRRTKGQAALVPQICGTGSLAWKVHCG